MAHQTRQTSTHDKQRSGLLSIGYRSYRSQTRPIKKKQFLPSSIVSILLYGCTTWTLTRRMEKKLDGNYSRMLRAILNNSWRQHPTKQQPYGHLPPVRKTSKIRRTRHTGHCWNSRDELVRDVLLWTPSQRRAKAGCPARTYIQQLCADPGCSPEDQPKAMDDREGWRERFRNIRTDSATWWWWWWLLMESKGPGVKAMKKFRVITRKLTDGFYFNSAVIVSRYNFHFCYLFKKQWNMTQKKYLFLKFNILEQMKLKYSRTVYNKIMMSRH